MQLLTKTMQRVGSRLAVPLAMVSALTIGIPQAAVASAPQTASGDMVAQCGYPVYGAIGQKYWSLVNAGVNLGCPVIRESDYPSPNTGRYQWFQNGWWIVWSPATGAHALYGYIQMLHRQDGGVYPFGYAVMDEQNTFPRLPGRYQYFQGGYLGKVLFLYAPRNYRPDEMWATTNYVYGAILDHFERNGREGYLGWPLNNEYSIGNCRVQDFENFYIRWCPGSGAAHYPNNGGD